MPAVRAFALAQCLAAALAGPALAQDAAPPGALGCTGCHGLEAGAPFPIQELAADEIAAALAGFRDGSREGTLMPRIAKGFSDEESQAIGAWFAAQGGNP
jgi:cytochrome c553